MIQRIQSIYLLIAILISSSGLMLKWSSYQVGDIVYTLTGLSTDLAGGISTPISLAIGIALILLLAVLFSFKNQPLQLRLANIALVQFALNIAVFSWIHYQSIEMVRAQAEPFELGYGLGIITPIISGVLVWMAKKAINKDAELLRSVDRLR